MQTIMTKFGKLTAQHTTDDLRKKEILPVVFHANGTPKSLPLEEQTTISTPIGEIPAELVTFHENGSLSRVFPLNGKLSGYWSEADEMAMAKPVTLHTPTGTITAKIIGVSFFDNEALRSITLCPNETITITTPAGYLKARIGVSFYPDGKLHSLEPASPVEVNTPAGDIMAYDPDAVGVNGDKNSLIFNNEGDVIQAITTLTRIKVVHSNGETTSFAPEYRESYCSDAEQEIIPMVVEFREQTVVINTNPESSSTNVPQKNHVFFSGPYLPQLSQGFAPTSCSM